MSATSSIDVYLGPSERWAKARDYQRFAYINFKETTGELLQKYYVDKGFLYNKMIGKIYPGIKKIEKKDAADAQNSLRYGNVIFTMKREPLRTNSRQHMYYMITEDDKHVPISDDPELKALHEKEESSKQKLDEQIKKTRVQLVQQSSSANSSNADTVFLKQSLGPHVYSSGQLPDDEVDEVVGVDGNLGVDKNGGKRKTKQKRTNKNKRYTRQTRRYFKR
jgi:hypothetical protein